MTARELIEALQKFNPELHVILNSRHANFSVTADAAIEPSSADGRFIPLIFIDPVVEDGS